MNHILQCHDITKTDFVSGRNCRRTDAGGRRYVGFESGCWSAALGYCHPRINGVMAAQIEKVMHLGTRYPNALAEEAAVSVLDITGLGDGRCVLLSSGSEAVEFGVQAVRRITRRRGGSGKYWSISTWLMNFQPIVGSLDSSRIARQIEKFWAVVTKVSSL